jgi:hypothetical protein
MLHDRSGTQCREPTAQRPERRIGYGVAQQGSLRLQALDRKFQLLKLGEGHGAKNSNGFVLRNRNGRFGQCLANGRSRSMMLGVTIAQALLLRADDVIQ